MSWAERSPRTWRGRRSWRIVRGVRQRLGGSLRFRLSLPFVVLVGMVLLGLSVLFGSQARQIYVNRLTDQLAAQALLVGDSVSRAVAMGESRAEIGALVDALGTRVESRLTIVDGDGAVLADTQADPATMENHASRPEILAARREGRGTANRWSRTIDAQFLYVAVPIDRAPGLISRVAVPVNEIDATVRRVQRLILAAAAAAVAMSVAIAWFISGRITRPLEDLRHQAHAVAAGDLTARVVPVETHELAEVGHAFNTMTEELQTSLDALDQTRMRLEAVLSGLADGVVLTDDAGLVLRLNRSAENLLEISEASAIGQPFVLVCRDYELQDLLRQALEGASSPQAAIEHGLNRRTLLTTASVVTGTRERLGLVVLRDISELRRLETVRREFVANVSHELRTPLTSIRAVVETLESGAVDDERVAKEFLGRIVGEVDRLTALVEDLLDLARLEAGRSKMRLEWIDPGELVLAGADRLRPQLERAGLMMTVTRGEDMDPIEVDRVRIEQVLINLVHNAIKFTPHGGEVSLNVSQRNGLTEVTVRDTGVGIAKEEQGRLFERFYKSDKARRSEGTGLGLAIAKHIVQSHGGEISVESDV
ncbi:MAG: HAMP domain-containing protein, partial [Chloroflexia bacterium]|nr:HAMP domain-containing protein [Chloroflexia bacterium]